MEKNEKTIAEKIRYGYEEHEPTKLEELKKLDEKVKRPASIFSYVFGTAGSLVLGTGMCLATKVIGASLPMAAGIVIGVAGIAMVSANYFIYKLILKKRKAKYADRVISLSNELLNG